MKVVDNKIVEATVEELFHKYLQEEHDLVMDFNEYLDCCKMYGTKIVKATKNEKESENGQN